MQPHLFEQKEFTEEGIMPDESTMKMIDAALERNAVSFKSSLEDSMNEKIATELRDKKMEMASKMFGEENSLEMQVKNVDRKKKEAAMDQNDIAKKGSSPVKG
jgi:hypothetical protein